MIDDIKKVLEETSTILKDHTKFIHLMSEDEAKKTLAKIHQMVVRVQMLLEANAAKDVKHPTKSAFQQSSQTGSFVKIRPCNKEYENKTYLGVLLGDVALGSSWSTTKDHIQLEFAGYNPAIYIPDLKKIIYGCESWWGIIKSEEDLSTITDIDIESVWYVKALKELK